MTQSPLSMNFTIRRLGRLNATQPLEIDPRWTRARVAYEVAKTRRPTPEERTQIRQQVTALALIILGAVAAAIILHLYDLRMQAEYNRVMQETARWVREPTSGTSAGR